MVADKIQIYRQPDCILPLSFFEGRFIPDFHPDSLDYEQWWDEQFRRCMDGWADGGHACTGPYYYHLNFKKINMLDEGKRPLIDHPFYSYEDQELFNDVQQARDLGKALMLITGRGFGKCLAKGTKVLMYNGKLKMVEDIVRGDKLMGIDSKPRTVLSLSSGTDQMYEVHQAQGEPYTINSSHILSLRRNPGRRMSGRWIPYPEYGEICNITVTEFISKSKKFKETFSGYRHQGIDFQPFNVFIDPYWLGLWLGDGNNHNTGITSMDSEVVNHVYSYANDLGMKVSINQNKNKTCPTYTITNGNDGRRNPLITLLRHYRVLNNKHIPFEYSRNSQRVRLEILAGLIDSDGYYKAGCYSFTLKDKQLIDDIAFLSSTLGFKYRKKTVTKRIRSIGFSGTYYNLTIYGNVDIISTRLARKKATINKNKDPFITQIRAIVSKGEGEYYGFSLDGDHLFILEDGTVTHNSFDVASICEHEFTFYDATECIISASVDLFADETWQKIEMGLNSQPDDLRLNLLVDKNDRKLAGTKLTINGKVKKVGSFSKMRKVVYDDAPGRTRGTRPNVHVFEEIGSWSGAAKLKDCYEQTQASWWRGSIFTCLPILIGTGGQMKSGASKDAREMGLDPVAHNILAFDYKEQKVCKFYPAYSKFGGYYEKTGVSDTIGAKEVLDGRRESKKANIEAYRQETQEFPYNIFEAFEESGVSNFDKVKLEDQFNLIMRTPSLQDLIERGDLKPVIIGNRIIDVEFVPDPRGDYYFLKAEHPRRDQFNKPIKHLYISGCDSFDAAEDEVRPELSPGCIRVFKRLWDSEQTGRIFVAGLTLRTRNGSEFYMKTLLLNMYYGCQMLYEHTNKGIASWYITNKWAERFLHRRPSLDKVVKESKSSSLYGIPMPGPVKVHCINLYKEYIDNYSTQMWFLPQLKDAMDFRYGSKEHHETMASSIALMGDTDMYNLKIQEIKQSTRQFPTFGTGPDGRRSFN